MNDLHTIGKEFYNGFIVKIFYTKSLDLDKPEDNNLYQILYIDEGSVLVGDSGIEKSLLSPVVLCLNYAKPHKNITISNAKGFSIFFKPEAINHGLIGNEVVKVDERLNNYLDTEELLIYPFKQSNSENPINLSVNGQIRDRILRMAENINIQFNNQPDNYWPCRGRSFLLEMLMLLQSLFRIQSTSSIELEKDNKFNEIIREIHLKYSDLEFNPKANRIFKGFKGLLLLKDFKKITGKSLNAYLGGIRCTVAENLLKNTLLEISEISRRCGFKTEKEFSKFFFSVKNLPPLSWRAKFPNPYG